MVIMFVIDEMKNCDLSALLQDRLRSVIQTLDHCWSIGNQQSSRFRFVSAMFGFCNVIIREDFSPFARNSQDTGSFQSFCQGNFYSSVMFYRKRKVSIFGIGLVNIYLTIREWEIKFKRRLRSWTNVGDVSREFCIYCRISRKLGDWSAPCGDRWRKLREGGAHEFFLDR